MKPVGAKAIDAKYKYFFRKFFFPFFFELLQIAIDLNTLVKSVSVFIIKEMNGRFLAIILSRSIMKGKIPKLEDCE